MHLVLLGAPGAGKGTQAAALAEALNMTYIASGDLFRNAIEQKTELGIQIKSYVERGELVSDDVTIKLILQRLSAQDCERGAVLDGFPRTLAQAKSLDKALIEQSKAIDKVIYIKVSEEELLRRLSGRWICRHCQFPYHTLYSPSGVQGKCDKCGGELYQRPDDTVEAVKKRLQVYSVQTAPLIDYYITAGKLIEIDGEGDVNQVRERIAGAITGELATR